MFSHYLIFSRLLCPFRFDYFVVCTIYYNVEIFTIFQEATPIEPWEKPRLSPEVQPYLYNLHIHPNLRTSVFKGKVTISLTLQSVQEHLAVHIKGLQITKTELTVDDEVQNKVELRDTFEFEKNEFWVMLLEHEIQPGKYKLFLEFNGKLTNKIIGFYQSVYKNSEGEER